MKLTKQRWYLWAEALTIFIVVPTLFVLLPVPRWVLYAALWGMAAWATIVLWRSPTFSKRRFFHTQTLHKRSIEDIMVFFIPSAFLMLFYTYYFEPRLWFGLISERPDVWARVMILYPILSVYPQELIYRGFFFRRYGQLFSHSSGLIAASAVSFGYLHIILQNGVAVILSMIGGFYFAYHYYKHRSLLLVSIEHSLYGCFVFTIGLGWYFYTGAVR